MNLRQVRGKIRSISNVKKITKAMQLVSAVKMRKAQQLAIEGRPYRELLESIISRVVSSVEINSPLLAASKKAENKELVIFISSNKGLCGSFNVNLFRLMLKQDNLKNMDFITIGKKGASFAVTMKSNVVADFSENAPLSQVSAIFEMALSSFISGKYNKVSILYNKFISTLHSESVKEQILPVTGSEITRENKRGVEYLIEPSRQELLESLLRNHVEEKIRGAIINSDAAEHSSRMIAMKNATDNANDVIYNLTLLRNKLRQQKITYELLDMITAKESVGAN